MSPSIDLTSCWYSSTSLIMISKAPSLLPLLSFPSSSGLAKISWFLFFCKKQKPLLTKVSNKWWKKFRPGIEHQVEKLCWWKSFTQKGGGEGAPFPGRPLKEGKQGRNEEKDLIILPYIFKNKLVNLSQNKVALICRLWDRFQAAILLFNFIEIKEQLSYINIFLTIYIYNSYCTYMH